MDQNRKNTHYKQFSEKDFITDPFFQDWVINPTPENEAFWSGFLFENPEKKAEVENGRRLLGRLHFKAHLPDETLVQQSFLRHLEQIEERQAAIVVRIDRKNTYKKLLKIAAVFGGIALLIATFIAVRNDAGKNQKIAVSTDYGSLDSLLLPDSSLVVLNANSKIEFKKGWVKGKQREVWLDGEAFFDVRHLNHNVQDIQPDERFIVHTKDLDIEVLGTSFDVRLRRGKTEVVLQSGKIRISFKDSTRKEVIMNPGDMLTYIPEEKIIQQTTTVPENYTAWKEKKLVLNDPTVDEIIAYLEDTYGKKITLQNAAIGKRKIDGPIYLNNLDDALFILSIAENVKVIKRDSTIILQSK